MLSAAHILLTAPEKVVDRATSMALIAASWRSSSAAYAARMTGLDLSLLQSTVLWPSVWCTLHRIPVAGLLLGGPALLAAS